MNQVYVIEFLVKASSIFVLVFLLAGFSYLLKRSSPGKESHLETKFIGFRSKERRCGKERREHLRARISWPVTMDTSHGRTKTVTKDVSIGGAFIICQEPLPLKYQFDLILEVPEHEPLALTGEVVWSNINVPDDKIVTRGIGVRFIQISEVAREVLGTAISNHLSESGEKGRVTKANL